jgi:hypothetical protein
MCTSRGCQRRLRGERATGKASPARRIVQLGKLLVGDEELHQPRPRHRLA